MLPAEKPTSQAQPGQAQRALNLVLASVAGLGGCLVLVIVVGGLLGGLALDNALKTRPLFTLLFVIGSMPVGIFVMYRVAMSAVARIKPTAPGASRSTEGTQGDGNS